MTHPPRRCVLYILQLQNTRHKITQGSPVTRAALEEGHVLSMVGVSPDISVSHSSTSVCTLASVRTASSSQCGFSEPGPANSRWLDPGRGAESLAHARFGEERWRCTSVFRTSAFLRRPRVLTSRVESTGEALTAICAQPLTSSVASQAPQVALQSLLTAGSPDVSTFALRFKRRIHLLGQSRACIEQIKYNAAHNSKRLEPC